MDELPARIGPYERTGIGVQGDFGRTYEATCADPPGRVDLTVIRGGADDEAGARLLRHADVLRRLTHPAIARLLDAGSDGGFTYLACEPVRGDDLFAWSSSRRRTWQEVVEVFAAAGRALASVHAAGVLHRAVSSRSIVVERDGRVRLIALGGSGLAAEPFDPDGIRGNPTYTAPEIVQNQAESALSDQYSFCFTMFEALYAVRPIEAHTILELLAAIVEGRVRQPPDDRGVPKWLHRAVLRGLSVRPGERWPSMDALVAAITDDVAARTAALTTYALIGVVVLLGVIAGASFLR